MDAARQPLISTPLRLCSAAPSGPRSCRACSWLALRRQAGEELKRPDGRTSLTPRGGAQFWRRSLEKENFHSTASPPGEPWRGSKPRTRGARRPWMRTPRGSQYHSLPLVPTPEGRGPRPENNKVPNPAQKKMLDVKLRILPNIFILKRGSHPG